jgi:predicted DCC family thiol-disulfide oxidoreductase YuxK
LPPGPTVLTIFAVTERTQAPTATELLAESAEHPIVLFDGVCNLCNGTVRFVIDRDPGGVFRFGSLQSVRAAELLRALGRELPRNEFESVVLIEAGRVYERSTAALRIARRLSGLWPLVTALLLVPRPIRDAIYRFIARHRYRWFGKTDQCWAPTPDLRARFVS